MGMSRPSELANKKPSSFGWIVRYTLLGILLLCQSGALNAAEEESKSPYFDRTTLKLGSQRLTLVPIEREEQKNTAFSLLTQSGLEPLSTLLNFKAPEGRQLALGQLLNWLYDDYLSGDSESSVQMLAFSGLQAIGLVTLESIERNDLRGTDASIFVASSYAKMGYGREITNAVFSWIKRNTQVKFIETSVHHSNTASIHLCQRIGMKPIREEMQYFIKPLNISNLLDHEDLPLRIEESEVYVFRIDL